MNYYEHHLGDYLRDTAHLSMLEDGAYRRLLDAYYIREAPLPAAMRDVHRLVRAQTKQDREAVETVLREFFTESPEGWRHSRCDREIGQYAETIPDREARRENDKERQRRARERRKHLFDELRKLGTVPAYDTKTSTLEELLSREQSRRKSRDVTPPVTRDNTATQTPIPDTNPNTTPLPPAGGVLGRPDCESDPDPGTTDRQPPPRDPDLREPATVPQQPAAAPGMAGAICAALRKAGVQRTNPGHPTLAALVQAGATVEELVALVPQTTGKAEPFAYLLAAAVGQRQRAAETAKTIAGPVAAPPDPLAWRKDSRQVLAMAERVGVKPRDGEGWAGFVERVTGAWNVKGRPALPAASQPQPQEAA